MGEENYGDQDLPSPEQRYERAAESLEVVNALFDAMSFAQAPYMFFMIAALTTIAVAGPAGNVRSLNPRHRPARVPARPALAEAT